tara:strand:+ start:404 stop:664 length:261 start_codon:yes stop_codon:yes gene_type:complete
MDARQKQIHKDAATSNSQVGKIYYSICPNDKRYFRTIRLHRNFATGNIQSQISNPVYGDPPPTMEPIPPLMRTKLTSVNNMLPYTN